MTTLSVFGTKRSRTLRNFDAAVLAKPKTSLSVAPWLSDVTGVVRCAGTEGHAEVIRGLLVCGPGVDRRRTFSMTKTVITFGTFDVFHVGHLRVLERAKALGDHLVVGVSSDDLNVRKKAREAIFSERDRMRIIEALSVVDEVFLEESLEMKRQYIVDRGADVLVMGDDWAGRFDEFGDVCSVVYLPRTPSVSTTAIIEKITGDL
jgi:glycerol-3-phosphate cytidylyltransferase